MAKHNDEKSKLISLLTEGATVDSACKKVGVSRMTFYRWRKDDLDFRGRTDRAIALGSERMNDWVESKLYKKIDESFFPAIKFHLERRHPRYRLDAPPVTEDSEAREKNRWTLKYLLGRTKLKAPPIFQVIMSLLKKGTPEIRQDFLDSLEDEDEFPRP